MARARGVANVFLWAMPQVMRDGFTCWEGEEDEVQAFDDVLFPLALGREAEVTPGFSTAILTSAGGREARNAAWAEARTTYDVGPGIRSAEDIAALLGFFRARMGPAGFPSARSLRQHRHRGGDREGRRCHASVCADPPIWRPVAPYYPAGGGSVSVKVAGLAVTGFALEPGGWLLFDIAPAKGRRSPPALPSTCPSALPRID